MIHSGLNLFKSLVKIETERLFQPHRLGRPRIVSFDEAYDNILKVVRTGMQWRHLQPESVSYITVFKTMHKWTNANVFRTAYERLLRLYSRKRRSKYYCIDSSFVKNIYGGDCTGRNPTDRGRKATKVSVVVDDRGVMLSSVFTPGNWSDMGLLEPTLKEAFIRLENGKELYADKGYDSKRNRTVCNMQGLKDRIFKRKTTCGRRTHAKRGVVERFFSWLDKFRRLLVRYEQRIAVYESMNFLACGVLLSKFFSESDYSAVFVSLNT